MAGKKIHAVNDELDFLVFISAVLEDYDATVIKASNGDEALKLAKSEKPDMITDVSIEIKRFIERNKHLQMPEAFMEKPIDRNELLVTIRKLIG